MTPEQEAILRDVQVQLRQIAELRTEIGDLETTIAELTARVRSPQQLPWPLSALAALLRDPAAVIGEQIARWEALVAEIRAVALGAPDAGTPALEAAPRDR